MPLATFSASFWRLFLVDLLLDLLDQRQHVAHVEDAAGGAIGMEDVQAVGLFADADELDRLAGDVAHRQRGAAAGIAVGLGQHHAGQRQGLAESLGGVGGVLAGHRIDHEQGLDRLDRGVQRLDLGHHRFVDRQAAGGIDDQHVDVGLLRASSIAARTMSTGLLADASLGKNSTSTCLASVFKLLDRGRTIDVAADHHHLLLAPFLQVLGELGDRGGLARALQAGHQDDRRRRHVEVEVAGLRTHHRGQFVVHDLDQRLARGQAGQHFLADRADLDALDQGLHHRQRDVRFEQRDAHLAQRLADVFLGQAAAAAQALRWCRTGAGSGIRTWDAVPDQRGANYNASPGGPITGAVRVRPTVCETPRMPESTHPPARRAGLSDRRRRPRRAACARRNTRSRAVLWLALPGHRACMPPRMPSAGASLHGLDLHFFAALSLVGAGHGGAEHAGRGTQRMAALGVIVYPLAGVPGLLYHFAATASPQNLDWRLQLHAWLALLAYATLAIAALLALMLWFQERALRRRQLHGWLRALPPLVQLEALLFRSLGASFVLLTLALLTGVVFVENLLAQHLWHKTVLSCPELAGARRAAVRPLALRLARPARGEADADRHGCCCCWRSSAASSCSKCCSSGLKPPGRIRKRLPAHPPADPRRSLPSRRSGLFSARWPSARWRA